MSQFFTKEVVILSLIGLLLIIVGESHYLHTLFPQTFDAKAPINTVLTTIGTASLGSGVFTAIIKSKKFVTIFKSVVEEVLWSKEFLKQRSDKPKLWATLSRLLYEEKFPHISAELEDMISTKYFPIEHDYYIEDYNISINIKEDVEGFWKHEENVSFTLRPINKEKLILYKSRMDLRLPDHHIGADATDFRITSFQINGIDSTCNVSEGVTDEDSIIFDYNFELNGCELYNISIMREKILCKKMNRDKRIFAQSFIKNVSVTLICALGLKIDFYRMGTINDFLRKPDNTNNQVKIYEWSYEGLILPKQGFIVLIN